MLSSDTEEDDEIVEPLLDLMKIGGGLFFCFFPPSFFFSRIAPSSSMSLLRACSVGTGNGFSITGRSFGGSRTRNTKYLAYDPPIATIKRKCWTVEQKQRTAPSFPFLTTASNSYGCGKCPNLGVPNACE